MIASRNSGISLAQSIPVYRAEDFLVVDGANIDDTLSFAAEVMLDDVYELSGNAERKRLSLHARTDGTYIISQDTDAGAATARVIVDSCLTVMTTDGSTLEMLLLVELDPEDHGATVPRCMCCRWHRWCPSATIVWLVLSWKTPLASLLKSPVSLSLVAPTSP